MKRVVDDDDPEALDVLDGVQWVLVAAWRLEKDVLMSIVAGVVRRPK